MSEMKKMISVSSLVLATSLSFGCVFDSPCDVTSLAAHPSPSGRYVAEVIERDCGATTDFSRTVQLKSSSSAGFRESDSVFVVSGRHPIDIRWEGDNKLQMICEGCKSDDIFKRATSWEDVDLGYEPLPNAQTR